LKKAKEAIDAPEPEKKKPFTRVSAFLAPQSWGDKFRPVLVTSVAEDRAYNDDRVWVVSSSGERSKERRSDVILDTPENEALIQEWLKLAKQVRDIETTKAAKMKAMKRLEIPSES
jgi:hypothetical protein